MLTWPRVARDGSRLPVVGWSATTGAADERLREYVSPGVTPALARLALGRADGIDCCSRARRCERRYGGLLRRPSQGRAYFASQSAAGCRSHGLRRSSLAADIRDR